mgnify:CR=1 FL=1
MVENTYDLNVLELANASMHRYFGNKQKWFFIVLFDIYTIYRSKYNLKSNYLN